ncbi:HXXEE domain-containing protein [bacterium]|nr:HXXEE domain-containing protein [bacterium]
MKLKPLYIALLLPVLFTVHFLEELLFGFPDWFQYLFNDDFNFNSFLIINIIALLIIDANAILYLLKRGSNYLTAVIGTLMFINGTSHILASFVTTSYSPGVATGIVLYVPLGLIIFKKLFPLIADIKRKYIVLTAVLIQIGVIVIALNV